MATYSYAAYDDDQITWPGGSPSNGDTITFTAPADHVVEITDNDSLLQDGTDDRDDEDSSQTSVVYDEFGAVETSGQIQPRDEITLTDGTNTYYMTEVYIASSNSYYYIFHDPAPLMNVTYTVTNVGNPNSTGYSELSTTGVTCFASGSLIETPDGAVAIETLGVGDHVLTLDNGPQPILWRGVQSYSFAQMRRQRGKRVFLIARHSFGQNRPNQNLLLSRQHRVLLSTTSPRARQPAKGGALAPIHTLTALCGVEELCPPTGAQFHHILTREHQLIWANGLLCETLLLAPESLRAQPELARAIAGGGLLPDHQGVMAPVRPVLENRQARQLARQLLPHRPARSAASMVTSQSAGLPTSNRHSTSCGSPSNAH